MPRNLHNDPFFTSTNPNCQYTNQTLRLDYAAVESNGSSCLGILRRYPSTAGPDPHVEGPVTEQDVVVGVKRGRMLYPKW